MHTQTRQTTRFAIFNCYNQPTDKMKTLSFPWPFHRIRRYDSITLMTSLTM